MLPASPIRRRTYRVELDEAEYFGIAAQALAEELLDRVDSCDPSRTDYTRLLGIIRKGGDPLIDECRIWLDRNPQLTRAMVLAGASSEGRIQRGLALYLVELANAA